MSRGRGRGGRGGRGFGGRKMGPDIMGDTMEELGLSYAQMEELSREPIPLYPNISLPAPIALTESDAFLVQKQRILSQRYEELFPHTSEDTAQKRHAISVRLTLPETSEEGNVFVPPELSGGVINIDTLEKRRALSILQPKGMYKTLSALEARESSHKSANPDAEANGEDDEFPDDDSLVEDMDDYRKDYYDSEAESGGDDDAITF